MERLTKREILCSREVNFVGEDDCFDVWSVPKKFMGAAIDRLAAYEDTELEPEEIETAMENCADTVAENQFAIKEINEMGGIDHLRELVQAEQDGRLVVLPCKVGDAVWYITSTMEICEAEVTGIWLNACTNPQMWLEIKYCSRFIGEHEYKSRVDLMLGKTIFLTREEAEATLEAQKGGSISNV